MNFSKTKKGSGNNKKKLDEIEEVYEEFNGFMNHSLKAFKSFWYLLLQISKLGANLLFGRLLFPLIQYTLWVIFMALVIVCTAIAMAGNKVMKWLKRNKTLNPFFRSVRNYNRIMKFDQVFVQKKHNLVLDLDGTLIHASKTRKVYKNGKKIPLLYEKLFISKPGEKKQMYYVYPRPHLTEALDKLSQYFNIVVFSGSEQAYCDQIVDTFDQWKVIRHRYTRKFCDMYQKDTQVFGKSSTNSTKSQSPPKNKPSLTIKKDLKRILEPANSGSAHSFMNPHSVGSQTGPAGDIPSPPSLPFTIMVEDVKGKCLQEENTILVKRWRAEDPNDKELLHLSEALVKAVTKNCDVATAPQIVQIVQRETAEARTSKRQEMGNQTESRNASLTLQSEEILGAEEETVRADTEMTSQRDEQTIHDTEEEGESMVDFGSPERRNGAYFTRQG